MAKYSRAISQYIHYIPEHACQLQVQTETVSYRIYQGICVELRRRLWRFVTVDPTNPESKKYLRSAAQMHDEEKYHLEKYPNTVHPFSFFRYIWESIMLLTWLQLFLIIPITIAFPHLSFGVLTYKTTLDLICHIDIILWFFTGYVDEVKQIVVFSLRKIAKRYIFTYFLIDLASSQPLHLYSYFLNSHIEHSYYSLHLLKALRFPTMATYLVKRADRMDFLVSHIKFITFTLGMTVLMIWVTCSAYMLINLKPETVYGHDIDGVPMLMTALSVTRALMVVGVTHVMNVQNFFLFMEIACITLGSIVQVVILAKVMQYYQKRSSTSNKYKNLMEEMGEYMKCEELPTRLKEKIIRYVDFKFQKHIFREEDIMNNLSSVLKQDILLERCQRMMRRVELFRDLPYQVMLKLVTKLRSEIFLPSDIIVLAGYPGNTMYFIYMGMVAVYTSDGLEICHLEDGSHFGEIALVINEPRVATVIAVKECELFRLSRKDFQEAIAPYPELNHKIIDMAMNRLNRTMEIIAGEKSKEALEKPSSGVYKL